MAFTKELTANDTGETGGHQAGIVVPRGDIHHFPSLNEHSYNPYEWIDVVDESGSFWRWKFIHYNNRVVGNGTRDEYRLTNMTAYLSACNARTGDLIEIERIGASYRVRVR